MQLTRELIKLMIFEVILKTMSISEAMHSPLEQFLIKKLIPIEVFGVDLSFTNSALFMVLSVALILGLQVLSLKGETLIPNRLQAFYEFSYDFICGVLKTNAGKDGLVFAPFIFSLFMFVLCGNLLGLMPYSFTFTSHLAVTAALGIMVFIFVTTLGFMRHGLGFFRMFWPKGVPLAVMPILLPVEIIAYLIRPLTLAVRLFANMTAGHMVLKLFGGFTIAMGLYGFAPLGFIVFFTAFEIFVALLQAYVFTVLTCIYINDALHLH